MGTVKIIRVRYLEDDVYEGSLPFEAYRDADVVEVDCSAAEAARLIGDAGLSFAATGTDWAANPDGSYVSDRATGERVDETAHLSGFHPRVLAAIIAKVG